MIMLESVGDLNEIMHLEALCKLWMFILMAVVFDNMMLLVVNYKNNNNKFMPKSSTGP